MAETPEERRRLAVPKSVSLIYPHSFRRMFAGLRSRCTTFWDLRYPRALTIYAPKNTQSGLERVARLIINVILTSLVEERQEIPVEAVLQQDVKGFLVRPRTLHPRDRRVRQPAQHAQLVQDFVLLVFLQGVSTRIQKQTMMAETLTC